MKLQVVSLLVAIISLAFAGPIDNGKDTCAHTCTETYKFGYRPGITYEYDYKVKTSTGLQGTLDGSSALEVTATVLVEALSKCNFILKVENTQLYEIDLRSDIKRKSEGSKRFKDDLEQHELKFSFQNGIIDRICASPNESIWVLNVKRGILSVFQNSMENFNQDKTLKESDVTGTCNTEYTVISSQQSGYVVKKTKNLLKCSGRHEIRTAMHGVPYGASTEFQSLPLMNSKHQCQQEISSDGLMNSARCVESHLFEPFSRKGKVTSTEIIQILEFVQETTPTATAQGIFTNHRTLLYEYGTEEPKTTVKDVETVLQQICKNTHTDIRPESTALFSKLVDKLQTLDIQSIKDVYRQLSDGRFCVQNPRVRKFFLDAIPLAGSTNALRFMTELIMTEDVTGPEANVLLTTLTFMQSPSKQMLQELTPLLSLRSGKALLPVSSLVHTYCRSTPCDGDVDIHNIMAALQNNIAAGCSVDDGNIRLTILSLRAIGNTGQPNQTVQIINSCLARSENPIEVRLAAIDAFRQFPCEITRSHLLMMFTNMTEDPELRITSYLAAIKCADTDTIDIINTTLEVEQVNQVGSFVLSHLTNLNETSNRHKQGIRNILSTFQLGNKFNLDKTKFSHNFEKSIFLQQYNIGSSFESNVVWTPSSFVPRSMSANLTIDLFGRSVNLLDIAGRFEGLDAFLESYFGPNGYFSDGAGNDFARQITKSMTFKKMMDIGSKLPRVKKVKGAFYVRVFGQELGYTTLSEGTSIFGEEFNILEMLISMSKNQEYTKTQNVQFLDSRFSVPTCAGFPLSLTVNGVVSIDVKVSGKMDIRKLITSPRSVSINGAIQPSAALEISGSMTLDAFVTRSGIHAVSNIHTSTVLQGKIEYVEGRNVDLELDMPREKIEIVNFKTAFFLIKNDSHREEIIITKNKQSQRLCTGDLVSTLSGLQLCSELEFLNTSLLKDVPPFLQAGSSNIKIHLLKMDNMSGYKLAARFIKTRQAVTLHLEINSPGSDIDRRIGADFAMDKIDPSFTLNIFSPWKKATFNGALQNSRSLRRVFGRLSLDSSHDYYVNAELLRSRRGHSIIYTPTFELRLPTRDPIRLEGKIVYLPFKTIDMDMMLSGITTSPVTTKGLSQ
ncbi:apolipophorins-like [Ylistrum balloti]|uniref:apolipophorins-like n=1 Tax=Ylistrum balloti TaxID=509963 RepID=UPI0029059513|nr:apolipophorins-like [Ylistrum balloti]